MTKTQQKSGKCPIFGFYHPTKEPMMCHEVQLSTDCPDDLSVFNTLGVYFEKIANNTHLKYTQHYRIATDAPKIAVVIDVFLMSNPSRRIYPSTLMLWLMIMTNTQKMKLH